MNLAATIFADVMYTITSALALLIIIVTARVISRDQHDQMPPKHG